MKSTRLALLGLGAVGSGVVRVLAEHRELLRRRTGSDIQIKTAVVLDPAKRRKVDTAGIEIVADFERVVRDPEIDIVVEMTGSREPAASMMAAALRAGKHVVTANKMVLAERGLDLYRVAREHDRTIGFEASVGGGVPIVAALSQAFAANEIQQVLGILNGTTNFILTRMAEENLAYSTALRLAQEQGFAEPDPTLDVSGADAAQKLSILARLAFQARVDYRDIPCEGIDRLSITDIRFAGELGYVVKLIAMAGLVDGRLGARVAPTLVGKRHALARVGSEFNMIQVTGSAVGDCYFMGRGAGSLPTASSIVADIADIVIGRAQATFKALELWSETVPGPAFDPAVRLTSRFYLRFMIDDRPGTLAQIAGVLGRFGVSIASVIQHDSAADGEGTPVPLIITTHHADETRLREALAETDRLGAVRNPTVCLHLVD